MHEEEQLKIDNNTGQPQKGNEGLWRWEQPWKRWISLTSDCESARWPKKKADKCQHVELSDSDEVEVADDNEWPGKDVEEVDYGVDDEQPPDEQDVSPYHLLQASLTYHTLEWWSQWPPMWNWPPRKACKKGINTWPPDYNDRQSHCEVQDKCY